MSIYKSKININSENFEKNKNEMIALVEKVHSIQGRAEKISEKRRPRFVERGQLTPRERLSALLDPEMPFVELYNMISYLVDDDDHKTSVPGGSIIAGIGFISGVRCLVFVDDSGINAGALTAKSIDKALGCLEISMKQKLPFIHLVESAGINLMNYTVEFWARTGGMFYGLAKLSAAGIPTIAVLHGLSTAGGAYQPGMSDYVVGVKKNGMAALAGPALLKAATGQVAGNEELGGSEMHARVTGLVEYLADDDNHAIEITRDIIEKLDWNSKCEKPKDLSFSKPIYDESEIAGIVPVDYRTPYEVRELIARIVDGSDFIDFKVSRYDQNVLLQVKPNTVEAEDNLGNKVNKRIVGIVLGPYNNQVNHVKLGPAKALYYSLYEVYFVAVSSLKYLGSILTGSGDSSQLGGPIRIAKITGQVAEFGIVPFLSIMAYISISLGLINLFPIPLLDGGHLMFYAFEKILGRPLSQKTQEGFFRIGMFLLLSLMFFATFNDLKDIGLF